MIKKNYVFIGANKACNNAFFVHKNEIEKLKEEIKEINHKYEKELQRVNYEKELKDKDIEEKDKKNEIDEISEIIYIFVSNVFNKIKDFDNKKSDNIFSIVENISKMKIKTTPGISNKCIFKHMDLLDELS